MSDEPLAGPMNADPRQSPWGLRTGQAWPEDPAVFFWFETEDALRQSLIEGHHATDEEEDHWQAVHRGYMRQTLDLVKTITPEVTAVFEAMELPFEVSWCGKFDELLSGNSPVALDARRDFFEIDDFDELPPTVGQERVDDFVEFLKYWGL